ncbi:MAG TPA: patatin-like phospholipase family protein [Nitrososphaeraceae archaeon]|jgi:NTE family protein|nr:patatin-like phospholipase family protein [Nitrososphaeraceae archaeon]
MPDNSFIENVLIMQGGGSLGAFGCGVFKALRKNNIKLHILAGTSIGGVNAALIAGSKEEDRPELALEQFWLELAENSVNLNFPMPERLADNNAAIISSALAASNLSSQINTQRNLQFKSLLSFYSSAIYGNDKMFVPRWRLEYSSKDPQYFTPWKWTYLYDHSPLLKTLEKYIDYSKIRPNTKFSSPRLIITAVNVLTAEPLTFDSSEIQISPRHLLATSGYPLYSFPWVEVEEGVYAWDGSLLSNTPLREVIDASPVTDKQIFLVENYPKNIDKLPQNLPEVFHRARDIMFSDKTLHNVKMSKVITQYLSYIEELYQAFKEHVDLAKLDKEVVAKIEGKYKKIKEDHGAEIKSIHYITREEKHPHMYENADFSVKTIKESINDGELKTNEILKDIKMND